MAKEKINLEDSMKKLEEIVANLERGESTLEQSLKMFEDGIKLSRECSKILDSADKKVMMLVKGKVDDEKETCEDGDTPYISGDRGSDESNDEENMGTVDQVEFVEF